MRKIDKVIQILEQQNLKPTVISKRINDSDWAEVRLVIEPHKDEYFIWETNIAIERDKIAWFQSSSHDNHLLSIYENDNFKTMNLRLTHFNS